MGWLSKHISFNKKTGFVYPNYGKYGISSIPPTILKLFNINTKRKKLSRKILINDEVENVVLFVIDGFGYNRFLDLVNKIEPLNELAENSITTPITSVFPSTTAAAITTFATGLTPQEHGIPEFVFYCKEIDSLFYPLLYSPLGVHDATEMYLLSPDPDTIFPKKNIFNVLEKNGIKTFSLIEGNISNSIYTQMMFSPSKIVSYVDLADMVVKLKKILTNEKGKKFVYVYTSIIDSISHTYGTKSIEYEQAVENIFYVFWDHFIKKLSSRILKKTEFLITADHGQMDFDGKNIIYLNKFRDILNVTRRDRNGNIIGVGGSPRDMFFYTEKGKLSKAREILKNHLQNYAYISTKKKLLNKGLFGYGKINKRFLERIGDLIIIPYNQRGIWFQNYRGETIAFKSLHGGLSPDEMIVPLIVYKK